MKVLVVSSAFGDYTPGQMIRDPAEIAAIRENGQAHFCTPSEVHEDFFKTDEELAPKDETKTVSPPPPPPPPATPKGAA